MKASTINKPQGVGGSSSNSLIKEQILIKRAKVDKFILAQVAFCTFPALVLMRFELLRAGSIWCFIFLLAFLGMYMLKKNIPAFVALIVATLPALSYTRGFFFFNSVVILLGLGLGLWVVRAPKEFSKLWNNPSIRLFFIAGTLYWGISVLLTGHYYSNIRVMEMLFSAGSIYLLAQHPKYLASALSGLGISIFSVAIGMFGQGDRLGMAVVDGEHVGNAITFGLPVVLVLLLVVADNGKWLFLQHSKIVRNVLIAMCSLFLLLSTSRGSWLVAIVGIAVVVLFQARQRRKVFVALLLAGCVLVGILQTQSGEKVSEWFEKITDSDRTLSQKTTGRFEQWMLFPKVLEDSPIWGVGPGRGAKAYADYSWVDREVSFQMGKEIAWHALYMQVGVETGMIGLSILAILLIQLIFRGVLYRQATGDVVPLIGILCFMTVGISVPGLDGIPGLYLGLAFLGTTSRKRKMTKEQYQSEQVEKLHKMHLQSKGV